MVYATVKWGKRDFRYEADVPDHASLVELVRLVAHTGPVVKLHSLTSISFEDLPGTTGTCLIKRAEIGIELSKEPTDG